MVKGIFRWLCIWLTGCIFFVVSKNDEGFDVFHYLMVFYLVIFIICKIFEAIRGVTLKIQKRLNSNKIVSDKSIDKLEKITILRLQGALTDEEFEEQKEKIMKKYK